MKILGVGIIGCGLMGGIHAECYARERGCRIVGFQNRSREKAEALSKKFGGKVYGSVKQLLADPHVDAVSITSSQQVHAEQLIAALRAGKHVLCEKPLALTPREMDAIEKAASRSRRVVMVAHQLRFHPIVEAIRRDMPKLGPVYHADYEWTFRIGADKGRCWADYRSGGFFMELGCHLADLARHLMGEVRHVQANTLRLNSRRVTEDYTHALLQFESNAVASLLVSANHRTTRQGMLRGRIIGQKGRIDFTIYPYQRSMNSATMTLDGGKSIFVPDAKVHPIKAKFPASLFKVYPGFFDVYQRETTAFLESIRKRKTPPITVADGRAAVEIILAAYQSQGLATDKSNFRRGNRKYRADVACHPALHTK